MKSKFFAILAALILGFASQAQAGLLGSTVNTQYYAYGGPYNGGGSPDSFVANGTPQNSFFNYYTLTVADTQVIYDFMSQVTWSSSSVSLNSGGLFITNGNLLSFSGAPAITSLAFNGASSVISGFSLANITFDSSNIAVDWQNITFNEGDKIILDINVAAIPEPETYAMLLAGLGLMGVVARRRRESL